MTEKRLLDNEFSGGELGCLFQKAAFYNLHAENKGHFFEWMEAQQVVASVHFSVCRDGFWRSPSRGTFAGYATKVGIRMESLFAFCDATEVILKLRGAQHIEVLPAPMAHDPIAFANQLYLLRTRGYEMTHCDINHSLEVDSRNLAERMTLSNFKRMLKGQREGLVAEELPLSALPAVYETLEANRASKGYTLSMSLSQLQAMAQALPGVLILFGCRDGCDLIASAVCLLLSTSILYVYCWGDRPSYATFSPVISVADAIYRYCQTRHVRLLDVGTSTVNEEPNFGLIQFKRGLGFSESLKVRMCKSL